MFVLIAPNCLDLGSISLTGCFSFSCERHSRAAASDFAKSCVHYVNTNLPENVRATVSHRDFMRKFIECFSEHFETEFSRRRIHHKVCGCGASVFHARCNRTRGVMAASVSVTGRMCLFLPVLGVFEKISRQMTFDRIEMSTCD